MMLSKQQPMTATTASSIPRVLTQLPDALPPPVIVPSLPAAPPAACVLNTIHTVLSGHFATVYDRLNHQHQLLYGTAYDHYLCECHVMEICDALNIQAGGMGGSTTFDGIQISRDDIADWLGIPHNRLSGMATEFKNAHAAHRLLCLQAIGLLPPWDLAFKGVLDAMLVNSILGPPSMHTEVSWGAQEAVSICIGKFNWIVREIIHTYSIDD